MELQLPSSKSPKVWRFHLDKQPNTLEIAKLKPLENRISLWSFQWFPLPLGPQMQLFPRSISSLLGLMNQKAQRQTLYKCMGGREIKCLKPQPNVNAWTLEKMLRILFLSKLVCSILIQKPTSAAWHQPSSHANVEPRAPGYWSCSLGSLLK